jgi:chromosome segregation ATPase
MASLDRGLRNMKFGQQVNIPHKRHGAREGEKIVAADALREEVTHWFRKCQALEQEVQANKALKHGDLEQQVNSLSKDCKEKETANKQLRTQMHKIEGELSTLKNQLQTTQRDRAELYEKNARMQKENVPMLNQMDKLLGKSREAVDVLTADAELLSNMFREQVKDNRESIHKHEEMSKELAKIKKELKNEKLKNQFKEDELQKKETLYLRTMAARKSIHEAYLEQKTGITEVQEKMKKREEDWQEMLKVVNGRDNEIKNLQEDLRRAHQRIDELEQQKKLCMTEFKRITGKPWNMLLEQFKAEPTSPEPSSS